MGLRAHWASQKSPKFWNQMPGKLKAIRAMLEAEQANKKNDKNLK
jgi:hypothetical protein